MTIEVHRIDPRTGARTQVREKRTVTPARRRNSSAGFRRVPVRVAAEVTGAGESL